MSEPLLKACPECGAGEGEPCQGRRGPRKAFHQARGRRTILRNSPYQGDRVEAFKNDSAEGARVRHLEMLDFICQRAESPIEELLAAALYSSSETGHLHVQFCMGDELPKEAAYDEAVFIYQQVKVGPYRADFVLLDATLPFDLAPPRWMLVECDGHDWHEKTKEQARHDKRRDRHFQSMGWKVLRFAGSEIWADPMECAEEVYTQLACDDAWRNRAK